MFLIDFFHGNIHWLELSLIAIFIAVGIYLKHQKRIIDLAFLIVIILSISTSLFTWIIVDKNHELEHWIERDKTGTSYKIAIRVDNGGSLILFGKIFEKINPLLGEPAVGDGSGGRFQEWRKSGWREQFKKKNSDTDLDKLFIDCKKEFVEVLNSSNATGKYSLAIVDIDGKVYKFELLKN